MALLIRDGILKNSYDNLKIITKERFFAITKKQLRSYGHTDDKMPLILRRS